MTDGLKIKLGNLFSNLPDAIDDEVFETIVTSESIKIERIVSKSHRTVDNYWYDQKKNEWVMIIKGSAGLRFENDQKMVEMMQGDYINIPAHCRHRVEWTDPDVETIWLAVHY